MIVALVLITVIPYSLITAGVIVQLVERDEEAVKGGKADATALPVLVTAAALWPLGLLRKAALFLTKPGNLDASLRRWVRGENEGKPSGYVAAGGALAIWLCAYGMAFGFGLGIEPLQIVSVVLCFVAVFVMVGGLILWFD